MKQVKTVTSVLALALLSGCAASDHIISSDLNATTDTVVGRDGQGVFVNAFKFRAPYRFENEDAAIACMKHQLADDRGTLEKLVVDEHQIEGELTLAGSDVPVRVKLDFQHLPEEGNYYYFSSPRIGSDYDQRIEASASEPAMGVKKQLESFTGRVQQCLDSTGQRMSSAQD
ncbi:hypothetical protein [Larsenimonas suaedae]|uniref:Lipoprotein n=1 Tax=Larsenimonas suaedae TaxID=1851019 RepID=A0ABU1GT52_9GAMM|nr:hypothetical protein [Larsenimonas suaedae]MCM2971647.1 hypothetical protein [Larsenimonas suaedae]MDR5895199.1 hypothetical protein [Larsenimonas suaedae]